MAPTHLLDSARIGPLALRNRIVRAATSESMACEGRVTDAHVALYGELARGGAGLIVTGHLFVDRTGQYKPRQTSIADEAAIPGLRRLVESVHAANGIIFAELSHAGSQSATPGVRPLAPSLVPNAIFGTEPEELAQTEIERLVDAFGRAARRAVEAGFDGIHIHGGNGYLISQFTSPLTNLRADDWGGSAANRSRFLLRVYEAIRRAVGPSVPVTARIGMADVDPGGMTLEEGVERVLLLERHGLDAVEVTYNIMNGYRDNIRPYVGVSPAHALRDLAVGALGRPPAKEAYYREFARALKRAGLRIPVILVGGIRSTEVMDEIVGSGDADFLALARPFIREPDLVRKIMNGRVGTVDCVSCNMCLQHEGRRGLRCWRRTTRLMLLHAYYRWVRDRL